MEQGAGGPFLVEVVGDEAGLRAVEAEWESIRKADPAADVFSGTNWFKVWWRCFGSAPGPIALRMTSGYKVLGITAREARPHVMVVRERGECVAVLPLILVRARWRSVPASILLSPLNGQSWRSGMVAPRDAERVFRAVSSHLGESPAWDVLLLDGIPRKSSAVPNFRKAASAGGLLVGGEDFPWTQSFMELTGTWEEFLAGKNKHFRKHIRNSERYLSQMGPLTLERHDTGGAVDDGMRAFLEIDEESWKAEDGESVSARPALRRYYGDLAKTFTESDQCEIWILRIGPEPVSAVFCLREAGVLYTVKSSYKLKYTSTKFSPGAFLLSRIIRDAWERGFRGIDFMGNLPILNRWATSLMEFDRLAVFRNRPRGTFIGLVDGAARRFEKASRLMKDLARGRARGGDGAGREEDTGGAADGKGMAGKGDNDGEE